MGDIPTTDEHGQARKHGDVINDNIDNLRPNQYYLGAKRSRLLTTDEHGQARKNGDVINDNTNNNIDAVPYKFSLLSTKKQGTSTMKMIKRQMERIERII